MFITVVQIISSKNGKVEGWLFGNNLNTAHLDYFHWILARLSGLTLCFYIGVARGFVYKKIECNNEMWIRYFLCHFFVSYNTYVSISTHLWNKRL